MSGSLGGSRSSNKQSGTQTTQIDQALVPLRDRILSQSMALSQQPIPTFQGPRVAAMSDMQNQAIAQAGALGQQGQGLAQRGFNILSGVGTADQRIGAYMNPFTQEVIDRSMSELERQRQMQTQQTNAQAIQARAFGGSRQAVANALTNEAFARQQGDLAAQLRMQGFNTALGAAQNDVAQQQALAQALGQTGYGAIQAMGSAGAMQQDQAQREIDAMREAQMEPMNLEMQRLDFLTGIASGVPQGGVTNSTGKSTTTGFGFNLGFGK